MQRRSRQRPQAGRGAIPAHGPPRPSRFFFEFFLRGTNGEILRTALGAAKRRDSDDPTPVVRPAPWHAVPGHPLDARVSAVRATGPAFQVKTGSALAETVITDFAIVAEIRIDAEQRDQMLAQSLAVRACRRPIAALRTYPVVAPVVFPVFVCVLPFRCRRLRMICVLHASPGVLLGAG